MYMYIYSEIAQRSLPSFGNARACSSWQRWCQLDLPGLDRPTSIDFGASTGLERPASTDLGASTLPERPTSIDFASILRSIFIVFRGKIGRPTRRAARCAEPLILLAGAVLQRVGTHGNNAEKRRISTKDRSNNASRTSGAYELSRFVAPRHDLAPILVTSAHPWTLLGAPCAQARPIFAAWTDPDRPTSIDLGVSGNPKRSTSVDLGASTGPALARTTCHGPIDPAGSTWLHRSGHVATA